MCNGGRVLWYAPILFFTKKQNISLFLLRHSFFLYIFVVLNCTYSADIVVDYEDSYCWSR